MRSLAIMESEHTFASGLLYTPAAISAKSQQTRAAEVVSIVYVVAIRMEMP
jgi:hypothetical protein